MDIKDILGSLVRGGVQVVAGVLASKGIIAVAGVAPFVDAVTGAVVGLLVFLGTLGWSSVSKKTAIEKMPPAK